jgi:hypothetical protein
MKKTILYLAVILTVALMYATAGMAQILPLTEEAMSNVTGQAGISISTDHLGFDIRADTIYYKDGDGIGPGTTAGFLSLTGVALKGSVDFGTPMTMDVVTAKDKNGFTEIKSVLCKISDMTLKIDSFYIDAIRLGNAPGMGNSLGSFGIENMTLRMTGNITIAATN